MKRNFSFLEIKIPDVHYKVAADPIAMMREVQSEDLTVQIPAPDAECEAPRSPMGGDAAPLPLKVDDVCRGAFPPPSPKKMGFFPPCLGRVVAPPLVVVSPAPLVVVDPALPVVVSPALPVVVDPEQELLEDMRELMRVVEAACLDGSAVMTDTST